MSERKKEAMFAKLAQHHAKAIPEEAAPAAETPLEEPPLSPAPPEAVAAARRPAAKPVEPLKGKRGHPDYCQANAYVPKAVRKAVDKTLIDMDGLDYSTLVTELLRKWLKARGVSE